MIEYLPLIIMFIVLAVIAVFVIIGARKGILRILFSTFSVILTLAIAGMLTVPVADFIREKTVLGESIETRISEYVDSHIGTDVSSDVQEKQDEFIDGLALPSFIKTTLKDDSTLAKYAEIGVKTVNEYLTYHLTVITTKAISFVGLAILVYILLRILFHVIKLLEKIPLLKGFNRFTGALVGLAEGLLIIWCLGLFVMMISGSQFGTNVMTLINANPVLSFLYNHNMLIYAAKTLFGAG